MVKTKAQVFRVVLDTNVLVSALLFGGKLPSSDLQGRVNDVPMFGIVQGAIFCTELLKRIRCIVKARRV
jgi:predicted nucleic acid-binding protein